MPVEGTASSDGERAHCPEHACRNVDGLDATSAQTFGTLWSILIRLGVELIITQLDSPSMRQLLTAHEVIGDAACMCAYYSCARLETITKLLRLTGGSRLDWK